MSLGDNIRRLHQMSKDATNSTLEREKLKLEHRRLDILENQPYVTAQIAEITNLQDRIWEKEDKAILYGILDKELDKVADEDSTGGSRDILIQSEEGRKSLITELNNQLDILNEDLALYYDGKSLAKNMDIDIGGSVSNMEIYDFINQTKDPEAWYTNLGIQVTDDGISFDENNPMLKGIRSYTLEPAARESLLKSKKETEVLDIKLKYLDKDFLLQQGITAADLKIKEGQVTQLEYLNQQSKESAKQAELQTSVLTIQLEQLKNQVEIADFEHDIKVRDDMLLQHESLLIANNQAQTAIGSAILSSLMLDKGNRDDVELVPLALEAVFTTEGTDVANVYEELFVDDKYNTQYEPIAGDLYEMVTAIGVGSEEEAINDYSLLLGHFQEVLDYNQLYNNLMASEGEEIAKRGEGTLIYRTKEHIDKMRKEGKITLEESRHLKKAVAWSSTGLFTEKNLGLLRRGVSALDQEEYLNNSIENLRAININSDTSIPLIQDAEESNIKMDAFNIFDNLK